MTSTILKKMKEKEKKPDRKSAPDKGLRRNKTTANFHRNKLDKTDKGGDKSRKSVGPKKSGEDKKAKPDSATAKTEGNEKKKDYAKKRKQKRCIIKNYKKAFK